MELYLFLPETLKCWPLTEQTTGQRECHTTGNKTINYVNTKVSTYNFRQIISFHIEVLYPSRLDVREKNYFGPKKKTNKGVNKHISQNV